MNKSESNADTQYLSTGEVSKKYNISPKTLHYYDDIGLLKPSKRNNSNGYRYYSPRDITNLMIIKYYQESGISLERTKEFFETSTLKEKARLFEACIKENEMEIKLKAAQRENLITWNNLIKEGQRYHKQKNNPFKLKEIRLINTLSSGAIVTGRDDERKINLRQRTLDTEQLVCGAIYRTYESYECLLNNKKQICFHHMEINSQCFHKKDYTQIGGFTAVSGIHLGTTENIDHTYRKLISWAQEQEIPLRGNVVERMIIDGSTTENKRDFVTEILLPIEERRDTSSL